MEKETVFFSENVPLLAMLGYPRMQEVFDRVVDWFERYL